MGLLDANPQLDGMTLGLLGAGQALMLPRSRGGGIGGAGMAFGQGLLQGEELMRARAAQANRDRLTQAQLREIEAQAEQRRALSESARSRAAKEADEAARRDAFWQLLQGGPQSVVAQTGGLAPTKQNAAMMNSPVQITPEIAAAAARAGIPLDTLRGVVESRNWGRDKVARTVTRKGPDGSPQEVLITDYGDQVGQAFDQPVKREFLNTGGAFTPVNPYADTKPLAIGMSQSERDASARGWAGVRNAQNRLAFDREQATTGAGMKPPSGYVIGPDGNLQPWKGGPADPATQRDKPLTEVQANAYMFANRADAADKIIAELFSDQKTQPSVKGVAIKQNLEGIPLIGGAISSGANAALSDSSQRYEQAKRDFINAVLRKESGAAIGKDEFANAERQYFPQPFEGQKSIKQKAEARRRAIEGLSVASGPLASRIGASSVAPTGSNDPLGIR